MKTMTVYFIPHSSFRGSKPPRSDTLFGAICWGYKLLFGNGRLEELLQLFTKTSAPFLLTSMFQYLEQNEGKTHFLPKPLTNPFSPEFKRRKPYLDELEALKDLKKLRRVHVDDFSDIVHGKKGEKIFYEQILENIRSRRDRKKLERDSYSIPLLQSFQTPHSSINRLTGSVEGSRFFYTEECFPSSKLGEKIGFFFCVKCDEEYEKELRMIFYFLADKGIGGGTSVGKGHIKEISIIDKLPYDEPPAKEASHVVTLSLTFPCEHLRKILERSWYELEKRQGKIESMYAALGPNAHVWKDHLLMLREGSTFQKNGQLYYGQNCIVRKDDGKLGFDVQQYGYAFTVNTLHIDQEA